MTYYVPGIILSMKDSMMNISAMKPKSETVLMCGKKSLSFLFSPSDKRQPRHAGQIKFKYLPWNYCLQRKTFVLTEGSDVKYFFWYILVWQQKYNNSKTHNILSKDKYFSAGFIMVLLLQDYKKTNGKKKYKILMKLP